MRLLEAIRQIDPDIRFYQASSSEMFGKVRVPRPSRRRSTPLAYGVAKVYAHWITVNYRELRAVRHLGHPVQHGSPRQGLEFVERKVSHGVARIKLGLDRELHLGNLGA